MKHIHWSGRATAQLDQTLAYWTRHNASPRYAKRILQAIGRELRRLSLSSYVGVEIHYRGVVVRRLVILRRFSLLYFIVGTDEIEVFAFLDNASLVES